MLFLVFVFLCVNFIHAFGAECRFASSYTIDRIMSSGSERDSFMRDVFYWEGQFHQNGLGINEATGMTYDGTGIDYQDGKPANPLHAFTAASKESIHLMLLARALEGNIYAQIFISPADPTKAKERAIEVLTKKIKSYNDFNTKYPGFAGYLPWVAIADSGISLLRGWTTQVPSLDNGELVWGVYAVILALLNSSNCPSNCSEWIALGQQYKTYFDLLATHAVRVFYDGKGNIRAVTSVSDVTKPPNEVTYTSVGENNFLDDPYEGELFAFFMDLYGTWSDSTEREQVWITKRKKLVAVEYNTDTGPITVQRGFWFSSHEQWKYLELPYLSVPSNNRVFMNGEKARTHYSAKNNIPGFMASVSNVTTGGPVAEYLSALGIQEIASEKVLDAHVITPYGAFPIMLANLPVGLAWYLNMIQGPKMQGPYGSTESILTNGTLISPVLTWDSKITSVIAMIGGITDMVQIGLIQDQKFTRFFSIVEREWSRVFTELKGEDKPFVLPTVPIPKNLPDFNDCK